jgi:hypothetical protein
VLNDLFEVLEPRRLLAGVTLITHGFGGSASGWVTAMGDAIAAQSGPLASQPMYLMTATDDGSGSGPITITSKRLGPAPANWGDSEITVLLDWSALAGSLPFGGYHRTTQDVASSVAGKFLSPFSIPDLAAPLAQLPIDLIGHSRGASLVSELAGDLGQHGVEVDQVTYLDPHPVDGVRDPLGINFGDAPMHVYANVDYAEDYWRTAGDTSFDFTGEPVSGAYNLQLSESILSDAGYSTQHSDVHLWYHGTIGPPFQDSDGSASVGADWYNPPQGPHDQLGWHFSRVAGGNRPSSGLKADDGAHRDPLTLTVGGANLWDNVSIAAPLSGTTLEEGQSLSVPITFQDLDSSAGGLRDATITLGFDRDDDPYNGVFSSSASYATSSLAGNSFDAQLPTSGIAGGFFVYAMISNGTNTRYSYAPGRAIVTASGYSDTWIGPASGSWSDASNWSAGHVPASSDTVAIFDSAVALGAPTAIAGLQLGGTASLVLFTNELVIDYPSSEPSPLGTFADGAYTGITGYLAAGAIQSPNAQARNTTFAAAEASDILQLSGSGTMTWNGLAIDATSILIKLTYVGDANLDGKVNIDDYGRIDSNVGQSGLVFGWYNGDFNFDGKINIDDYGLIDGIIGAQGPVL